MKCSLTDQTAARNVRADAFVAQMERSDRAALVRAIEQQNVAELERAAIAARIKQARKEAGLSQPEMAEAIGVIPRTYQNYESVKDPRTPWSLMNDIAMVTGKTTEWLIHGDRKAPDLLGVARDDQVEGGFVEFRQHVRDLEDRLDRIETELKARVREEKRVAGLIDDQNQLLQDQSRLLATIKQLLGMDGDVSLQDRLIQMIRDAQAQAASQRSERS